MGRNIDKDTSKHLSSKYNQRFLDHAKQSATDAIKTAPKRAIQKKAEATGDLIGNKYQATQRINHLKLEQEIMLDESRGTYINNNFKFKTSMISQTYVII